MLRLKSFRVFIINVSQCDLLAFSVQEAVLVYGLDASCTNVSSVIKCVVLRCKVTFCTYAAVGLYFRILSGYCFLAV